MATVILSSADDGRSIGAHPGDEIVLRLAENPTTGYRWQVERVEGPLEQGGDSYLPDPNMQFGSGGVRELHFKCCDEGRARLELKHWQAWEGESSVVERFAVDLTLSG